MTDQVTKTTLKSPTGGADGSDESEFATFENPRLESVEFHVERHWSDLRVERFGDSDAATQDVRVSCNRCAVRYVLEDLPSRRVPGREAFENLST